MIKYIGKEHLLTYIQVAVIAENNSLIEAEVKLCIEKIKAANMAHVPLPHTNELGYRVTNGCNILMYDIANYWGKRLRALENLLGDVTFKELTGGKTTADISMAHLLSV